MGRGPCFVVGGAVVLFRRDQPRAVAGGVVRVARGRARARHEGRCCRGALGVAHVAAAATPTLSGGSTGRLAGARRLNALELGPGPGVLRRSRADRAGPTGGDQAAPDLQARTEAARILARSTGLVGAGGGRSPAFDVRPIRTATAMVVRCLGPFAIERRRRLWFSRSCARSHGPCCPPGAPPAATSTARSSSTSSGRAPRSTRPRTALPHAAGFPACAVPSAAGPTRSCAGIGSAYSLHVDGAVLDVSERSRRGSARPLHARRWGPAACARGRPDGAGSTTAVIPGRGRPGRVVVAERERAVADLWPMAHSAGHPACRLTGGGGCRLLQRSRSRLARDTAGAGRDPGADVGDLTSAVSHLARARPRRGRGHSPRP